MTWKIKFDDLKVHSSEAEHDEDFHQEEYKTNFLMPTKPVKS